VVVRDDDVIHSHAEVEGTEEIITREVDCCIIFPSLIMHHNNTQQYPTNKQ
jgi:hypothetical protein